MDIQEQWDRARKHTEIIRMRMQDLATFESTAMPYIFLAESTLNKGDTLIRRGQVMVEKPSVILPPFSPHFEGFSFDEAMHLSDEAVATFLLIRGVQFPSLKYRHQFSSLDVVEKSLREAVEESRKQLTMAEDVKTGLVIGPEEGWQFSVLMLVGALVVRSAQGDLKRILEDFRRRQKEP